MLELDLDKQEFYDTEHEVFLYTKPMTIRLEHSLISISKWEAEYKKPFLPSFQHEGISGEEEILSYVRCMIIGNVPEYVPLLLTRTHMPEIMAYIAENRTASRIHNPFDTPQRKSTRTITSELIYWWMIRFNIPPKADQWHLSRLLTLIEIANEKEKESDGKKRNRLSPEDSARFRQEQNKKRKKELGLL
jgi:hypothetical protein